MDLKYMPVAALPIPLALAFLSFLRSINDLNKSPPLAGLVAPLLIFFFLLWRGEDCLTSESASCFVSSEIARSLRAFVIIPFS